jgi:hypothetical protein
LPPGPGLGIELAPEMFKRPDVTVDLFTTWYPPELSTEEMTV